MTWGFPSPQTTLEKMMSHKTRSHYLIREKMCLESRKANRRWALEWTKNERELLYHKQGEGDIKRLQHTARTTHLGILVSKELVLWRTKDLCSLSQLYSGDPKNVADGEGGMQ